MFFYKATAQDFTFNYMRDRQIPNRIGTLSTLAMVETAFLASAVSLIWYINFYFSLGSLLRVFFPIPIALVYLRWGKRAAWMSVGVASLLLFVLMGLIPSLLFLIPYGVIGVLLGVAWHRRSAWIISICLGTLIGTLGFFFRLWLTSIWSGRDLWQYASIVATELIEWGCDKLGLLIQPNIFIVQAVILAQVVVSNFIYLFAVHLVAWWLLERIGNSIPHPPHWVQVLMNYE